MGMEKHMFMSKKCRLLFFILLLVVFSKVNAQDEESSGSKKSLMFDLTSTQTSYSDSWVGGEAGSVNWVANLSATSTKKIKKNIELRSRLKLSFGQTLTQDAETKKWSKPDKSTDLIDFENVGSFSTGGLVDPYVAFRIETQFYDGANPDKKLSLSPLKLTESAGASKKFYETETDLIVSRLGLGVRQIITKSMTDTITLAVETSTAYDGGIESVSEVDLAVHKNIRYNGKLTLFKALESSKSDDLKGTEFENDWKAVDLNFENSFSGSITKLITVNLYLQFLYDKEISHKIRIKQTLALGFVFKLN